jgi:hypothetical protein
MKPVRNSTDALPLGIDLNNGFGAGIGCGDMEGNNPYTAAASLGSSVESKQDQNQIQRSLNHEEEFDSNWKNIFWW